MSSISTIHIIGAGLAGLAAGLAATGKGARVVLYEASPQAGGRCRSFYDKKLKTTIDNGNHLLLGANRAALGYLAELGTLEQCITSDSYPFTDLATRLHWQFRPPRFKGIPAAEWRHLLKLLWPGERTVCDCIPADSLLFRKLIEPFTLAALNTPAQDASAAMLGNLLRQMLHTHQAWRAYVPAYGLSAALVDPTLTRIKGRGGAIHYGQSVQRLTFKGERVTALHTAQRNIPLGADDQVILAVPPFSLAGLLPDCAPDFSYETIINAHFLWPQAGALRETMPFLGVVGGTVQWIFFHEGRLSTTTSAANSLANQSEEQLAQDLWHDICRALYMDAKRPPPYRIIKEKRATFAATPSNLAKRPNATTPYQNLFLAGDYLQSPYPATLEAAISSGYAAASLAYVGGRPEND